jgi:hypothetical protein
VAWPVISATQEVEGGTLQSKTSLAKARPYLNNKAQRGGGVAQMVECLLSKCLSEVNPQYHGGGGVGGNDTLKR